MTVLMYAIMPFIDFLGGLRLSSEAIRDKMDVICNGIKGELDWARIAGSQDLHAFARNNIKLSVDRYRLEPVPSVVES